MSYILDALKKSEQERGHGKVPGVQTMHSSSLSYRNEKKLYWPYILIVAVILNLLAILYFIMNKDKPSVTVAGNSMLESPLKEEIPVPVTADSTHSIETIDPANYDRASSTSPTVTDSRIIDDEPPAAADNKMAARPAAVTAQQKTAPKDIKANKTAVAENIEVIEFYDLPESIKNQLPAIIISAHVYSTNPQQRSIVINNNFMEAGEYVIDDLLLREITADGAIFDYQGTRFHYGVVSSWQ
jgi:general secretion pathway protein B